MFDSRWHALAVTGLAVVFTLSTWFSATAVAPQIALDLDLSAPQMAWLTNAVQGGFVVGALCVSFFALADVWPMPRLLAIGALSAGLANGLLLLDVGQFGAIFSRFATGMALALVYPTAMKYIGTWFVSGRGLAMGVIVGALTLGSASPHLIRAIGIDFNWQVIIASTSLACLFAALIFLSLKDGPHPYKSAIFKIGHLREVVGNKAAMLANVGYCGHMWELYALWGWLLAYVTAAKASGLELDNTSMLTFAVISVGASGCVFGGWLADRIGRCFASALVMAVSGCCALLIGFVFDGPPALFITVAVIWGFSTIADSAQFSAAVSEVSDSTLVGASLAFQMGVGFAITIFVVWLIPQIVSFSGGWQWAFSVLAIGPAIGIWSMLKLREHPDAYKMANGKR
jgi:MFS family permease